MNKHIFYEFINYFFFYFKIIGFLKSLIKKKKKINLNKLNNTFVYKRKNLFNINKLIKKKINKKINNYYLYIFNKKFYFNSKNMWDLEKKNEDKEIFFYKIRFSWLLFGNDHLSNVKKIDILISFIEQYNISKSDSYSLGERISNWIIFIKVNEDLLSSQVSNLIKQSINDQIPILIDNLEYYEDKTNNHLLSNIKAIFLFSVFFKEKSYFNLCNEVFDFIINHIFYKSGFLNEGSSHYHLLISKHVIEILYFNEIYNDNILSNKHIKFFKKVLSNIHIFSVTNNLVNFGDSTPDLPIQYLKSLTYISNKVIKINYPVFYEESNFSCKNYSNLFKINNIRVPKVRDLKYSFYDKESGYVFISNNNIKIYLQLRNSNIIKSRTHQHTEIGNFILYYKNKMIFNDLGRKNYNKNSILSLGSNYHNSFKINNLEPLLCHKLNSIPSMMHQNYFQKKPEFIFTEEQDKFKINIKFFGYERFHFKSVIERNFDILENQIEITDIIESKKQVKFNSYFHTSLNIIKKDNIYNLFENDSNLCQLKILDNNTFSIIKQNVSFNEYSINQKINSILISKKLQKKDNIKYIIKFN